MSLLQNYESVYGASFKGAYHRILEANFDYQLMIVTFKIGIYADKLARDNSMSPLYIRKVTRPIDEEEYVVRKPTYDYLKTTNNYSESKNV